MLFKNNSPIPENMQKNQFLCGLDQTNIFGETPIDFGPDIKFTELWFKNEDLGTPALTKELEPEILSILRRSAELKGKLTNSIGFEIESYSKEGTANGVKGVSRVVLINEFGQRVLDTQIKLVGAAQTKGKQQT